MEGVYDGELLGRLRHGEGTYVYPNAFFKYSGAWLNGKKHGAGVLEMGDGGRIEGQFVDGEIEGDGSRRWASGATYEGQFHLGEMHGEGVFQTPAGERYDGQWQSNRRHGQGTLSTFVEGEDEGKDGGSTSPESTYTGQFVAHKKEGEGELVVAVRGSVDASDVYRGQWLGGQRHGQGEERLANGGTYMGGWRDGFYDGTGEGYDATTGVSYTGEWTGGCSQIVPTRIRARIQSASAEEESSTGEGAEVDGASGPAWGVLDEGVDVRAGGALPTLETEAVRQRVLTEEERLAAAEAEEKARKLAEEEEAKASKGKGKGKGKKGKKADEPQEEGEDETQWEAVAWESGRLLRVTVRQIMEPADDAEEGTPPPMREQALLLPCSDENEGKDQDDSNDKEGNNDDVGAKDDCVNDGGEEKPGEGVENCESLEEEKEKEKADEDEGKDEDEGEVEVPPTPADVAGDAFDALDPAAGASEAGDSQDDAGGTLPPERFDDLVEALGMTALLTDGGLFCFSDDTARLVDLAAAAEEAGGEHAEADGSQEPVQEPELRWLESASMEAQRQNLMEGGHMPGNLVVESEAGNQESGQSDEGVVLEKNGTDVSVGEGEGETVAGDGRQQEEENQDADEEGKEGGGEEQAQEQEQQEEEEEQEPFFTRREFVRWYEGFVAGAGIRMQYAPYVDQRTLHGCAVLNGVILPPSTPPGVYELRVEDATPQAPTLPSERIEWSMKLLVTSVNGEAPDVGKGKKKGKKGKK